VRQAVAEVAQAMAIAPERIDDIKTAVSEACNNVVLHAYEGRCGPLEIEVHTTASAFDVVVRDHGGGMRPQATFGDPLRGVGVAVIAALSDRIELRSAANEGTEVRMRFATAPTATSRRDAVSSR